MMVKNKQIKVEKEIYSDDKEQISVGTIGHVDHGKTTLTQAIANYCFQMGNSKKKYELSDIMKTKEEIERGITIDTSTVEYESSKRHFSHVDMPGHQSFIKNMITGASQIDFAILVVSLSDGIMPQTEEHILLIKQLGVNSVIVFLNKADILNDEEVIEGTKMMIKELLLKYKYDVGKVSFVVGSALKALKNEKPYVDSIGNLIKLMDEIPLPERDRNAPFLFPIDHIYNLKGIGTILTGRVDRGTVTVEDKVDIVGLDRPIISTSVRSIETFKKSMKQAFVGYNVGLSLRNVERSSVERGQFIVKPGSVKVVKEFKASIYSLKPEEGGRKKSFGGTGKFAPQFFLKTIDVTGTIKLEEGVETILPGDTVNVYIKLAKSVVLEKNWTFAIRESSKTIAIGTVLEVL